MHQKPTPLSTDQFTICSHFLPPMLVASQTKCAHLQDCMSRRDAWIYFNLPVFTKPSPERAFMPLSHLVLFKMCFAAKSCWALRK